MKLSTTTLGLLAPSSSLLVAVASEGLRGLRRPALRQRSLLGLHKEDLNPPHDPYLWLEDIRGNESLAWVEQQNNITLSSIQSHPLFNGLSETLGNISMSDGRIPYFSERHGLLYNFWRDANHERGILRRTTLESYKTDQPAWETILDIDALSTEEDEAWVYQGLTCLEPEEVH